MTVVEAARKWDVSRSTVAKWIRKGLLPAEKVRQGSAIMYVLPDDATPPPGTWVSFREPSTCRPEEYIWANQDTLSIGQIKQELGLSSDQIRELYDQLFDAGRRDFPEDGDIDCEPEGGDEQCL